MKLTTITSNDEISSIFSQGFRLYTPYITFLLKKNKSRIDEISVKHDHFGRVAFIASKKLGNAVWRNKAKRRMRALCKELGGPWPEYDVIFLAKSNINSIDYSTVLTTCEKTLKQHFKNSY